MNIYRDLVHAVRSLAKSRAFTVVCVLSLGIGMAPVIGIQYALRAFITPPPGVNTDGLVELLTSSVGLRRASDRWSYADFVDLRKAATGAELAGWARGDTDVTLPDSGKTTARTLFVSSNYFRTIGVAPARGPGFPALKNDTADPVVILAHRFWQRLGSDPDIVGKMLTLNGVPHVVAGLAAEGFEGHFPAQEAQLFIPLERHPTLLADSNRRFDRSRTWVHIHGRLAPGVGVAQASAAISAFTAQLAKEYPSTNESTAGVAAAYHPLGNIEGEDFPIVRAVMNVMTAIPLFVVCLNVSGMVQVRSAMRERELSIRQAIGASRRRLMQHLLAEAAVLAVLGGTLASLLLFNIPPVMSWWFGEPLPTELQRAFTIDVSKIAICAGLCLATTLVFGWLPALRFSRPAIVTVLKDDAGGGRVRAGRVHRVTSALQVAIAVPPLVLSAMALERMRATTRADLGFAADLVYAAPVEPGAGPEVRATLEPFSLPRRAKPARSLEDPAESDPLAPIRRVRTALASASGVASVTVADGLPLDYRYRLAKVTTQTGAETAPSALAHITRVGDGYLDTMGIALLGGRTFTSDDGAGAPLVTVISKALADTLFPGGDAIGQPLTFESGDDKEMKTRVLAIVGVIEDFPTAQINTDREQLLLPLSQHPDVRRDSVGISDDRGGTPRLMLIARAAPGEPPARLQAALENTMRDVNRDFDRATIVSGASLLKDSVDDFLTQSAFGGIGGGVALLLAALGIYGVVGLMVTTRLREMAVRVTLGASRARLTGMILFDVVKLVAPGVVAGALITFAIVRLEGGITLSNIEPLAYVVGGAIALLTAVLASLPPARRAASVEPMVAMRST